MTTTMMMKLQEEQSLTGHSDRAWFCAWSPDGKYLATSGADKTVRIYKQINISSSSSSNGSSSSSTEWTCIDVLQGQHSRTVRCVSWAPNGTVLACASFDGTVSIWEKQQHNSQDEPRFECISTLEGHENEVKSCAWDVNGQLLATCGRDKTVWIWEVLDGYSDYDCISVLNGHTQDVKIVQWHPTMEMLLTASYDDTVRSWVEDIDDWYCADIARTHKSTVWSISCNRTGSHMVSGGDDLDLVICKLLIRNGDNHESMTTATDQDSDNWATSDADKKFMWKEVSRISGLHTRTIYSVDWAKNGHEMIATAAGDDAIRIFNLKPGSSLDQASPEFEMICEKLNAHEADLNCVAWNPTQPNILATASDDSVVKIWRLVQE